MQTRLEKSPIQKNLLFSLLIIGFTVIVANFFGEEIAILTVSALYVPIPGALVVLSIFMALRYGIKGDHAKAWLFFIGASISWFIAELLWLVYELVLDIDPFPSEADFFYFLGYPFLFFFSMFYLKPVKTAISKKIVFSSILVSSAFLIPTLYLTFEIEDSALSLFEAGLAASYPVADSIVLVPAIIGLYLFFTGRVNFMWSLMFIAILMYIAADTAFLFTEMNETYYSGHPIEILFLWSYVLFSFGLYDNFKIFRKSK